jgi:hypothetical protein
MANNSSLDVVTWTGPLGLAVSRELSARATRVFPRLSPSQSAPAHPGADMRHNGPGSRCVVDAAEETPIPVVAHKTGEACSRGLVS